MFTQDQLLPISALQHLQFCPRQWGLIHLEQIWSDNALTAQGNMMHSKVHNNQSESRDDLRIARGLRICSFRLGLIGQADVVEFHKVSSGELSDNNAIRLSGVEGYWQPFPVEYKRGKLKKGNCDNVQLCAQVLCLEEMLKVYIPQAAFFYGRPRKRYQVIIDEPLRQLTKNLVSKMRRLTEAGITPTVKYSKKCDKCSLLNQCMPRITGIEKKVTAYIKKNIQNETIT